MGNFPNSTKHLFQMVYKSSKVLTNTLDICKTNLSIGPREEKQKLCDNPPDELQCKTAPWKAWLAGRDIELAAQITLG